MNGQHTYSEISSQPDAWQDALNVFTSLASKLKTAWQVIQPQQVILIGCGSTHFLAQAAAALFQAQTHKSASAYPASELILFPEQLLQNAPNTLLITISRSGTTTETIEAVNRFRARNGRSVWTITCYPESPLAQASDFVLPSVAAQEESVAQTKSFASMLIMAQALAASLGGRSLEPLWQLPAIGRKLIETIEPLAAEIGQRLDIKRHYFLGSGYQYGVANEIMLKMTEMTLTPSQAFHFMEYRHGPMSMATEQALVTGLLSPQVFTNEHQVLKEMAQIGAHTLAMNPTTAVTQTEWQINLPIQLPDWVYPVLYLPPLHLLAYHRALSKGLDPDNPRNLTAVVHLDKATLP